MEREKIYEAFEALDKKASQGGGIEKIEKQHESGRMTARERIDMLLDNRHAARQVCHAPLQPLRHGEKTDSRRRHGYRLRQNRRTPGLCLCL